MDRRVMPEQPALNDPTAIDLLTLINEVPVGLALTDGQGLVRLANRAARRLLRDDSQTAEGVPWERLWPWRPEDRMQLREMANRPTELRESVAVQVRPGKRRRLWVDVRVGDDPRAPGGRVLTFTNESEIHELAAAQTGESYQDMIGKSEPMRRLYKQIQDLSCVDATVLLEGETGAGKELVARAIHESGPRRRQPFVAFNCAGLTDTLIGSQLFGHKRGSFTGAIVDQEGLIETAHGGTLLLDEIGDISPDVQRNLLRVLQEREIMRVGEARSRKVDVRVIAATHRDLAKEVEAGRFRADLLYRIRVARIVVPPLRDRRSDIPLLVEAFLERIGTTTNRPVRQVSKEAMRLLLGYPWPGNVRELRSAVEFAVIRAKGLVILPGDLPPEFVEMSNRNPESKCSEKERVLAALRSVRGNRSAAARLLGIGRATLYRRLAAWDVAEESGGLTSEEMSHARQF
jgi:DNA-binding NtrC family response regulator